ncbi:MAG: rod shape-determining protein MreC [Butyricicoccaceae bacterium]
MSRNPGDTAVTLTLDKGTAHGVAKGDLVTTIDGMVGYVSEAGSNTCEVTTVTDVDISAARSSRARARPPSRRAAMTS